MAKRNMTQAAQAVLDQALQLPPEERAKVLDGLYDSFNHIDPGIEAAWIRVAESRLADYDAGKVSAAPVEELFKRLNERHKS